VNGVDQPIYYVALGDSLTEGFGVPVEDSFVQVYRSIMSQRLGRRVHVHQAGVTGETTQDIWQRLTTDNRLQEAVREAHILSLTAGGNDLLIAAREFLAKRDPQVLKAALREYSHDIGKIIEAIKQLRTDEDARDVQVRPLVMRIMNLYNPFPIFEETVYWVGRFNKEWRVYETPYIRVVDVYHAFLYRIDELIGEDMVHPNKLGYRVMAETADAVGYNGLEAPEDCDS